MQVHLRSWVPSSSNGISEPITIFSFKGLSFYDRGYNFALKFMNLNLEPSIQTTGFMFPLWNKNFNQNLCFEYVQQIEFDFWNWTPDF